MDIVAAINVSGSLARFLESSFNEHLSRVGLEAAKISFSKLKSANDKKSVLLTAISHLEIAQANFGQLTTLIRQPAASSFYYDIRSYVNPKGFANDAYRLRYIYTLTAVCYKYLEEEVLFDEYMEKIRIITKWIDGADELPEEYHGDFEHFFHLVSKVNPIQYMYDNSEYKYSFADLESHLMSAPKD